jgi:hypothetical protein
VTVICLDLKKAFPLSAEDAERYSQPENIKAFAQGVAHAQAFNRERCPSMPQEIADAILHIPEEYRVGRCGLRPITSTWAKLQYPEAKYELLFTTASHDGGEVHTLLMYFP